ncbi:MAG TPA: phosphatase PAP2 family protein [Candidatus Didemnitutus sp.]|nr:phosphatase PAP2 family protein [Candidatus Didemnitutus sp.]
MTMRPIFVFLFAASVALGAPPASTHDFIAPDAVDFHTLVPSPPDPTSIAARGEQDLMRNLQIARTPDQATMAKYYEKLSVLRVLAPVLGDWCDAKNLPKTAALFEKIRLEARPIIEAAKSNWNRNRPYIFDSTLQPVVERPANTSYPSGHSYDSAMYAVLLSHMFPEHEADWWKQAALVRWSRVIGGAHYPSDTVAGKILGEAVGKKLLESPALLKALEEARQEISEQLEHIN